MKPCPSRPCCVSSEATDARHAIDGFRMPAGVELEALVRWLETGAGARLEQLAGSSARLHFRTRWLRFVDDLELEAHGQVVAVRSCSRVGYWDFGLNRRRLERVRAGLQAASLIV